jgi:glycosyltransferase involved in cell wall biosynthesis
MSRSTLSCCLVIKNEQDKIASCLNRINVLADEIIIVDTGSTDKTPNIIQAWIEKYKAHKGVKLIKVGSQFHDSDGDFDFGAAKTFAMKNATKDFVMWLDATDTIENQKEIKESFLKITNKSKKVYFALPTALSDKFAYVRTRIGPRETAYVSGRVHEFMTFTNVNELTRVFIPISIQNRKKNRDLSRNLRLLLKEWDKNETSRTAFYIALTYREMMRPKDALEWYRKRIYRFDFIEEFREEFFKALESIAELVLESLVGSEYDGELMDVAMHMIELEPTRVEGYYYMGKYHMKKGEYDKSLGFLRKYTTCKRPKGYKLWLNGSIYNGKAILNAIEQCKTAMKYTEVLIPDEILDYGNSGTHKLGNSQYY